MKPRAGRISGADLYSERMADQPNRHEYRSGHDPRTLRDALGIFADGPEKRAMLEAVDFAIERAH